MGNQHTKPQKHRPVNIPNFEGIKQGSKQELPTTFYESENDDDFFDGIGSYFGGDQNTIKPQKDLRKQVQSAYSTHPFNAIVRIISIYKDLPAQSLRDFPFGSGVILTPRIILTVAHNVYAHSLKAMADYVFVQVQTQKQPKPLIRVLKIGIHKAYFNPNDQQNQFYDMAILILEENNVIKPNMTMKIKQNHDINVDQNKEIIIAGFPKDRNDAKQNTNQANKNTFYQFYCTLKILRNKRFLVNYINTTNEGQSGSPIIFKSYNKEGHPEYFIIGVHKGFKGYNSYGILTTMENTTQIPNIARSFSLIGPNSTQSSQFDQKKNQLLTLINKIESESNGKPQIQIDNVKWKNMPKKDQSLNDLLYKSDPQSFRKAVQNIQNHFNQYKSKPESNSNINQFVIEQIFHPQKILKGFFGKKEQQQYFVIVETYIDFCLGNQNQAKEAQFYAEIGERLHSIQTKIKLKKDSNQISKDTGLTLSKMEHSFIQTREKIIKKIKNLSTLPKKQAKSKQQTVILNLNFLKKFNDPVKSISYIDSIQQQDENDQILLLKAEILKNIQQQVDRSIIFYEKIIKEINQNGIKKQESLIYIEAITKLGEIYRIGGNYAKCKEYFTQNLEIQKKQNPAQNTIKHAEALNYFASYQMDIGRHDEALKKIRKALQIAEKVYGKDSIELVKFLNSLSLVHYEKSQPSESLIHSMRALQIIQNLKGENSLESIQTLNNIASALRACGKKKQSLEHYQKALKLQEAYRGPQNLNCAPILSNIALFYLDEDKYDKFQETIRKSIGIYQRFKYRNQQPVNKIGYGLAFSNVAFCYNKRGEFAKVIQNAEQSIRILKGEQGMEHRGIKILGDLISECKKRQLEQKK